jgi:anaerobic ribonucleoside-triphosphate reductase activating protein
MKIASTQYNQNNKAFEIYLSGCSGNPKCEGCHNPELWNFNIGNNWEEEINKISKKIKLFNILIDNIWILGGEPLDQNINELKNMVINLKQYNKKIWLFTRYKIKEIDEDIKNLFNFIKCGKYDITCLCDDNIMYNVKLETSNQKIYKKGVDYCR